MKKHLCALFAVLTLTAGFFVAAPAQAYTLNPITVNNVTCNQHVGGSYPDDGHFYDCTTNAYASYGTGAWGYITDLVHSGTVPTVFTTAPEAALYVFNDAVAMAAWFNNTNQGEAAYNQYAGYSASTLDPTQTVACESRVFVNVGSAGNYPTETEVGSSAFSNTVHHELGHCFDDLANGSSHPSTLSGMTNAMAIDLAYMKAHDANYTSDYNNGSYWFGDAAELFAEEFAVIESGSIITVDATISAYWGCSMFYTRYWILNQTSPTPTIYTQNGLSRCN